VGKYFEAIAHGYMPCAEVDEETWDEQRVDFAVVLDRMVRLGLCNM
jgi:hypothetical protein